MKMQAVRVSTMDAELEFELPVSERERHDRGILTGSVPRFRTGYGG